MSQEFEIQNLIHNYMFLLDDKEPKKLANLWIENGTIELPQRGIKKQGHGEIEEFIRGLNARFTNATHWEANVVIEIEQDSATNRSYWKAIVGGEIISQGRHFDTFKKVDGIWKFDKRIITFSWTKADGFMEQPIS